MEVVLLDSETSCTPTGSTPIMLYVTVETIKVCVWLLVFSASSPIVTVLS